VVPAAASLTLRELAQTLRYRAVALWVHRRISVTLDSISPAARYCRQALAIQFFRHVKFSRQTGLVLWENWGLLEIRGNWNFELGTEMAKVPVPV
jgi:hypothetical protein